MELIQAAAAGDVVEVACRLAAGADPNTYVRSFFGLISDSPLHSAAKHGHVDVIELLLAAGACAQQERDKGDATPLHLAAQHGHVGAARVLAQAAPESATAFSSFRTPMHLATQHEHLEVLSFLLDLAPEAATASLGGPLPLHVAVLRGFVGCARLLIEKAPAALRVPGRDGLPLHMAIKAGNLEMAALLILAAPGHVNGKGVHLAARHGRPAILLLLLGAAPHLGSTPDPIGWMPLHEAAAGGSGDAVGVLLHAQPATATARTPSGCLPLHCAAMAGKAAAARRLVHAFPATVCEPDHAGATPFSCAVNRSVRKALGEASIWAAPEELIEAACAMLAAVPVEVAAAEVFAAAELARGRGADVGALLAPLVGRMLPAVLARSHAKASLLVAQLPHDNKERLRRCVLQVNLCMRAASRSSSAPLPQKVVRHISACLYDD